MYEPKSLAEFMGQDKVIQQVGIAMKSAVLQKKPFPHTLLAGFGGTGKTTLSKLIAETLKDRMIMRMPATLKNANDVWDLFNDEMVDDSALIYFIDEIHRLDVKMQEELYVPMENGIIVRKNGAPSLRGTYQLKPFTLIGATTNPGKLTEPFRSRFGLTMVMQPYTSEDMRKIVTQAAEGARVSVEPEAVSAVISRSRASPRIANHLLDRCHDMMVAKGEKSVTLSIAEQCFALMEVDENGLNDTDRRYLTALYNALRPLGPSSLEPILHLDRESITSSVEPYLVESGWVSLTRSGRELTKKGIDFVEMNMETKPRGLTKIR